MINSSTKFSNAILRVGDNFVARSDFSPSPAEINSIPVNTAKVTIKRFDHSSSFPSLKPGRLYSTKLKEVYKW